MPSFHCCLIYNALFLSPDRTTWCVFPFTLVAMSWIKLLLQFRCSFCELLCCPQKLNKNSTLDGADEAELAMLAMTSGEGGVATLNPGISHQNSITPTQSTPAPFTELALQYGSGGIRPGANLLFHSSMTRDSLSTPTPSTNTETGAATSAPPAMQNSQSVTGKSHHTMLY